MDGQTDIHVQHETIISRHYRVVGYKNVGGHIYAPIFPLNPHTGKSQWMYICLWVVPCNNVNSCIMDSEGPNQPAHLSSRIRTLLALSSLSIFALAFQSVL